MPRAFSLILLLALLLTTTGAVPAPGVQSAGISSSFQMADNDTCGYLSGVDSLLGQVTTEQWQTWIRQLSGVDPVTVGGQELTILTRWSNFLFDETLANRRSRAFDFVHDTIQRWYPSAQIEEDAYQPNGSSGPTWKNLILTVPGAERPNEIVILSAHLDSRGDRYTLDNSIAPGADDNATGSATLLEAARVLQGHPQPRTIRLIWFTGEEQGLKGSAAYVADHSLLGVVGDINVDMFGYDGDNDRCFELHVGTLSSSNAIGRCFVDSIQAYNINVKYDYLTISAVSASDHASFWSHNIGAVEVLENYQDNGSTSVCTGRDWNPDYHYHTTKDTIDHLSLPYSFDVARAALAATFSLANLKYYLYYFPLVKN
jgi:leucyl aminopeptidase